MEDKKIEQTDTPQSHKPEISNPLAPWKNIEPIPLAKEERAKQ